MRKQNLRIEPEQLRWNCPLDQIGFDSTQDIQPEPQIIGQPLATEALRYGLLTPARSQHIYVRGPEGSGRKTLVRQLLEELRPGGSRKKDRCYVYNFKRPDRPRLISLPPGRARVFRRRIRELAHFIAEGLPQALDTEAVHQQREQIRKRAEQRVLEVTRPLEEALAAAGLQLVSSQVGPMRQLDIFPLEDNEPISMPEFRQRVQAGKISAERAEQVKNDYERYHRQLDQLAVLLQQVQRETTDELLVLKQSVARNALLQACADIRLNFGHDGVPAYLDGLIEDVLEHRVGGDASEFDPHERYDVNILIEHNDDDLKPVVVENNPSLTNLLGSVDLDWSGPQVRPSDYRSIHAGALLRADGGYLVMEVHDLLTEMGAWRHLMRILRCGQLEIVPSELGWLRPYNFLQPEAIKLDLRVILIGDAQTYALLSYYDQEFSNEFKVLADIDPQIEASADHIAQYAQAVAAIVQSEGLRPFSRAAVGALIERSVRMAGRPQRMSARFGLIADIAREASFLAAEEQCFEVDAQHVRTAVKRRTERGSLPAERFRDYLASGTVMIQTQGAVVGQINALAVIQSGSVLYGIPGRLTASVSAGSAGLINIEREASLSGEIHTKGFQILGGLLRHLLQLDHPLAISASICFEQSYGGIDGDSASAAEFCCLISALAGAPIDQQLAITGSIDQHGHIQAIGGVNEKVEGFFRCCQQAGLTGEQGVLIPASNASELMLSDELWEACARGDFHLYALTRIEEALELLTGVAAGTRDADGHYADSSLLGRAVARAGEFWQKARQAAAATEPPAERAVTVAGDHPAVPEPPGPHPEQER